LQGFRATCLGNHGSLGAFLVCVNEGFDAKGDSVTIRGAGGPAAFSGT
jgi:hypothetical protein